MLININSPQSQRLCKASGINDRILGVAKRMTLIPTSERMALLAQCQMLCDELSTFNDREDENDRLFISHAIVDLYKGCETIAHLQSNEDHTDGQGICPVCNNPIFKGGIEGYPSFYCSRCLNPISDPRQRLDSPEGMGFCVI